MLDVNAMGRTALRQAAVGVLFTCASLGARADGPTLERGGQSTGLESIVVTATRVPTPAFEVPALTYAESSEEVRQLHQSRTLPEALGELPGVMVQKTSNGQGSPFMRGYTGFRNVLLVDGIRLNNSVFREGANQYWNTVDPYSLGRIEVLKGPASVLYGSDAIGGAVNVLSDIPAATAPGLSPQVLYRYAAAESSQTIRAEAAYGGDPVRARGGYSHKDYGDVEGGRDVGEQPKTGYDEQDADLRVEYDFTDRTSLALGYQYVDQDDAWRTHRTIHGVSWHGTQVGSDRILTFDQQRQLGYLQLTHAGLGAFADTLRASASYHRQREDQYRLRSNLRSDETGFDVGTSGLWVQLDKRWGRTQFVYGADYYSDDVDSYGAQYNADGSIRRVSAQGPVADDATYDLAGVFGQAIIDVSPRVTATLAGRYTHASVDARVVEDPITFARYSIEDDWDDFSASARLAFRPAADGPWMLYAGVAQAFRAPNLSDLTRLDSARSNEIETPSPGLTPEEFLSWEAGLKFAGERLSLQAAYFSTDGEDVIVRTPTGRIINDLVEVTKTNGSSSKVRGVEAQLSYQLRPQLLVFGDGFWLDGEADAFPTAGGSAVREPLDVMMPATVRLGARWTAAQPRLRIEAIVEHAEAQDRLSTRDELDTQRIPPGGTPGYTVFHLRSEWQLRPFLTLSLAVENLTDEDYRIHGSGLNEPGRNVVLSMAAGM